MAIKPASRTVDEWFDHFLVPLVDRFVTILTGKESGNIPRPPLWVRRAMLLTFPFSFIIGWLLFFCLMIGCVVLSLTVWAFLATVNYYRTGWSD